jgi:hypothetical protein
VLLGGAEGDHYRFAPPAELRLDLAPGQLVELERTDDPTISARAPLASLQQALER